MPADIRKWTVGLVVGVCLVVILGWATRVVCFGGLFGGAPCRTIDAYTVFNNGANEVAGAFRVRKSVFNAIQSYGVAGSCITADYAAFNLPKIKGVGGKCSTDDDCHGPILSGDPYEGWESICHQSDGTCWVRPGASPPGVPVSVCTKDKNPRIDGNYYYSFFSSAGPFKLATLDGKVNNKPILNPAAVGKPLRMRLVACLNGVDPDGGLPPCADDPSNRIYQFSDVTAIIRAQ